jgi:hypothetical protein
MPTRTKVPMSKPRSALPRVALLALALTSLTCSDDGGGVDGNGLISGTVFLAEPVEGAVVTVNRWDGGIVGAEVCRTTTDAAGAYACQSGKYFGIMLVTATGGHTTEQGAALTLPAGSVLRAPLLDLQPQQQRTIHLNPASDLIVALGTARATAGQDADLVAAVTHAHALLRTHLDADPVTVAPKSVEAATAFDEPARVALVLRGLGEYAHTAAVDQAVSVQAINTRALLDQLVKDAASAEARFDGNGTEVLSVGPACQLPTGCTAEGPGCYASCSIHTSSLRGRLANAAVAWLGTPANRTGLRAEDVLTWATALTNNTDDQLFGPEPPEDNDTLGPVITWATPAAGQVFTTGTIMIDVTAADPLGVATLGVDHVVGQTRTPITDTDPAPERFIGALPLTPTLAEGTLTLEAHATDRDTNPSSDTREVSINQLTGGAISGVAIKAALASAPVTVRTFTNAAAGAIVATGTTDPAGNFTNVQLPEGTQGDLLLEVGGAGTYAEDAQPATVVSLAATEKLSVVLPAYTDGDTIAGLVVSPATTLAVAYTTYLQGANQGGADVAAKWATAVAALERHTGVTGLTTIVPSVPSQIDTLDDADRYGLLLLALSRTAWHASALGGGDAGAFGSAVNAMKVLQVWVRDLGDGCWDGKAGPTALSYGGPTLLTDEATRLDLAQALVAYLASAQNQTQFAVPADVLPLLDTWATGGGNAGPGSCAGTNHTFDDAGASFDREGPVITWGTFPATDPFVRGMVTVTATAVDNLPTLPSLVFTTGQTDIDVAVNGVRAVLDTTGMNGPVPLAVRATDGSTNATTAMHDLIADNLAPAITITAPAMDGLFLRPPVTLGWSVVEANPMATTATLDAITPVTPGFQIAAEGAHSLSVTATDRAGGSSTATRTFTIDGVAPVLNVTAPASGTYVRGPVTVSWTVSDANPGTTATATLNGTPITSPHTFNGEAAYSLVVNATDAAGNPAATVTRAFTIDNTPPAITATAISGFVRGPITLTFSATDNNPPATVTATLDTVPFSSGGQVNTEIAHALVVNAVDRAGNTAATVTRNFTVDNTPPVLSVTAPAHGSYVRGPVTMSFSITDANPSATATATFDGAPFTSGGSSNDPGPHTLVVSGTDAAGNPAATVTRTFTIDNTPPVITISGVVDGGAYNANLAPTFSATDTYTASPTVTATLDGTPYVSGALISSDANHVLVVTATDQAGNSATATRTFLLDKLAPSLSLTSQVPTGTYVRGMLAFTVTGDDALASMGSLSANVGVTATLNSVPVAPSLSYPVVAGGRRQVVATFAAGALADGTLRLTFTLTDRAGNVATPLSLTLTVDNTAPTGVTITGIDTSTGGREYWDAGLATRFVNTTTPTLIGNYTEANPGATVTVMVGTSAAGSTTSATAWRATAPAGSVTSAGNDATVTITDAAGNATSVTQRLRSDLATPTVDSPTAALVHDEAGETIALGATKPWRHTHAGVNVALGGPGATCPELHKYAYLTAVNPEAEEVGGAGPNGSNPITFNWSAADGGAGVQQTSLRYLVRTPGGATRGPYAVAAPTGSPVSFNFATPLYRNTDPLIGIPEVGVPGVTEEGVFIIDVYADDRVGNTSLVASRCWTHRPRGVPVKSTNPVQLTSTFYGEALTSLRLDTNGPISTLLNGTHPGAGFMTYSVENTTNDAVWLSFTPSVGSLNYTRDWRSFRSLVSEATVSAPNCTWDPIEFAFAGADTRCSGDISGAATAAEAMTATNTMFPVADLSVRLWEDQTAMTPNQYAEIQPCTATPTCAGRFQIDAQKKYQVVVGAKRLTNLQPAGVTSGFVEDTRSHDPANFTYANPPPASPTTMALQSPTTVSRTHGPLTALSSTGPGVDQACTRWSVISGNSYRCSRIGTYQSVKYLYSAAATFNTANATGAAHAGAGLSLASQHGTAITLPALNMSASWTPTEN